MTAQMPSSIAPSPWLALRGPLAEQAKASASHEIEAMVSATVEGLGAVGAASRLAPRLGDDLVTIVVTLFNCAPYVDICVASLLAQSHPNLEVVLVDDGSHDATYEVALRIARQQPCVRVLRTLRNAGTYVAKNLGLTEARGRYVTFQDCDDLSHPTRLAVQLQALRADPDRAAVSCHYARIDEDTGRVLTNRGERSRPGLISLMIDWPRVRAGVGFFDSVRVNADDEFKTRIRRAFGERAIVELPDCHYYALLRQDGLTMAGHTANDIGATDLKSFLAPVRQRYTAAFQAWHRESAATALYVDFPGGPRPFPSPVSIDPFHGARFAANALLLPAAERPGLEAAMARDDGFYASFFSLVVLLTNDAGSAGQDGPRTRGLPPTRIQDARKTPDKLFKEVADLLGGGAVLLLDRVADLNRLTPDRLRRALYTLMSSRPRAALVSFNELPSLYVPLEAMDVSRSRFVDGGGDLMRAATLTALKSGGELVFQ